MGRGVGWIAPVGPFAPFNLTGESGDATATAFSSRRAWVGELPCSGLLVAPPPWKGANDAPRNTVDAGSALSGAAV